jgi:hypothetical protein
MAGPSFVFIYLVDREKAFFRISGLIKINAHRLVEKIPVEYRI